MSLWNPEYRVKINGFTVTGATLGGLTIRSGRTDIYSQPTAGYCSFSLIETDLSPVEYEINQPVSIEVKDSAGNFVFLFGGFLTDVSVEVQTSGSTATSQRINIIAVGALARLARAIYDGNLSEDQDGDQIYALLSSLLYNTWNEVPSATTWSNYNATTTWADAENSGIGEIDRPGDYLLEALTGLNDDVYSIASLLATSGLGYLYEDSQGRIGYADSTHRNTYLTTNGYVFLDGNHALGNGLNISKRAGDVRNNIEITYKATGNQSVTDSDPESIALFGNLATSIRTTLKNQTDAETQAAFYLGIRSFPQYELKNISFPVHSTEIDDADRDALLGVFMGMPVSISNLPANMVNGQFQGFVEGWTWTAAYNRLNLTLTVSPTAYSLQATRWNGVNAAEAWNTLSNTLEWIDATIVA